MFAPSWSAKVEYEYYNFGSASFTAPPALVPTGSFTTDDHTFKAGVNYRFNWGSTGGRALLSRIQRPTYVKGPAAMPALSFCAPARRRMSMRRRRAPRRTTECCRSVKSRRMKCAGA
jgi:hypothetical protein